MLLKQNKEEKRSYGINLNLFISSINDQCVLDSEATDHMTENKNLLFNFKEYDSK
jgi:hypothetical protein